MGIFMFIVCVLLRLLLLAVFARVLLSWFPFNPNGTMATVAGFLYTVTDPVMSRVRRLIPPVRFGGMALDLSPIVVIFGITVIQRLLSC